MFRAGVAAALGCALPACGDKAAGGDLVDSGATPDGQPDGTDSGTGPPSFGPRPYYVVGHNPNSIPEVIAALDAGANGIEPDIDVFADGSGRLCVSHDAGGASASSLEQSPPGRS